MEVSWKQTRVGKDERFLSQQTIIKRKGKEIKGKEIKEKVTNSKM